MTEKEVIEMFHQSSLKEINHFLWEARENNVTVDIAKFFSYFNYDVILTANYEEIEALLFNLMAFDFERSEIYKTIVYKALTDSKNHESLIHYLIKDFTLDLLSTEQLKSLKVKWIWLEDKKLGHLPEEIGEIISLEDFQIIGCDFKSLPASLLRLKNLKKLVILFGNDEYDYLELPNIIENLTSLEDLSLLFFNTEKYALYHIRFPISFEKLTLLKTLRLSDNKLWAVPKELVTLPNLETLDLSYNNIKYLPDDIGNLHNLKHLSLSHNPIDRLPESFMNLSTLETLEIKNTNISQFPLAENNLDSLNLVIISEKYQYHLDQLRELFRPFKNSALDPTIELIYNLKISVSELFMGRYRNKNKIY